MNTHRNQRRREDEQHLLPPAPQEPVVERADDARRTRAGSTGRRAPARRRRRESAAGSRGRDRAPVARAVRRQRPVGSWVCRPPQRVREARPRDRRRVSARGCGRRSSAHVPRSIASRRLLATGKQRAELAVDQDQIAAARRPREERLFCASSSCSIRAADDHGAQRTCSRASWPAAATGSSSKSSGGAPVPAVRRPGTASRPDRGATASEAAATADRSPPARRLRRTHCRISDDERRRVVRRGLPWMPV